MDVWDAICRRASVRAYATGTVPRDLLIRLVEAGRRAPSGRNVQPVEFVVVTESATRQKLAALCEYGKFLAEAPACIVVYSADTKYYLEDGCAAVENILLAATGLGLASCWVAGDKKPYTREIDQLLNAPEGSRLIAFIAIGFPREKVAQKEKKPLDRVLHWEKF